MITLCFQEDPSHALCTLAALAVNVAHRKPLLDRLGWDGGPSKVRTPPFPTVQDRSSWMARWLMLLHTRRHTPLPSPHPCLTSQFAAPASPAQPGAQPAQLLQEELVNQMACSFDMAQFRGVAGRLTAVAALAQQKPHPGVAFVRALLRVRGGHSCIATHGQTCMLTHTMTQTQRGACTCTRTHMHMYAHAHTCAVLCTHTSACLPAHPLCAHARTYARTHPYTHARAPLPPPPR